MKSPLIALCLLVQLAIQAHSQCNVTPTILGTSNVCKIYQQYTFEVDGEFSNYQWQLGDAQQVSLSGPFKSRTLYWLTSGTKTIGVRVYDGTCWSPYQYKTINVLETATISGNISGCLTDTYTYTTQPGMSDYQWQYNVAHTIISGGTGSDNYVTLKWNAQGGEIKVTYTTPENCTLTANLNFYLNSSTPRTISGPAETCTGVPVTFTTEAEKLNYEWSVASGTILSGQGTSTVTVSFDSDNLLDIFVDYDDPTICRNPDPDGWYVSVYPTAQPTITLPAACVGSSMNLLTESNKQNYSWNVTGVSYTPSTSYAQYVTWTTAGTQTITVSYSTPECPTVGTKTITVNVGAPPPATVNGTLSPCVSDEIEYTTDSQKSNYAWSIPAAATVVGGSTSSNLVKLRWSSTTQPQYLGVSYLDGGCMTSKTVTVVPKIRSNPTINGSSSVCAGLPKAFNTQSSAQNYTWSSTPDPNALYYTNGAAAWFVWNTPGTKTVYVNYNYSNTCPALVPASFTVQVVAGTGPATITGSSSVCQGETSVSYTTESQMSSYWWTPPPGATIASGQGTNQVTLNYPTNAISGDLTVSYNSSGGNCGNLAKFPVTVKQRLVPVLNGQSNGCVNGEYTYTTNPSMSNYAWTYPTTDATLIAGGTANDNFIKLKWTVAGSKSISVNYTNPNGCPSTTGTATGYVSVVDLHYPVISANQNCVTPGNVYSTESGFSNYVWDLPLEAEVTSGGNGSSSVTITWPTAGGKTLKVSFVGTGGCPSLQGVQTFTVKAADNPQISGSSTVCENSYPVVKYTTTSGKSDYQWKINGTPVEEPPYHILNPLLTTVGTQTISVSWTDASNCKSLEGHKVVSVVAKPTPTIDGDANNCNLGTSIYTSQTGMASYQWHVSPVDHQGAPSGNSYGVTWAPGYTSGGVHLKVTDTNGCEGTASKTVTLFTPSIAGVSTVCAETVTTFTTDANKTNYVWEYTGGALISGGTESDNSITLKYNASGDYTLKVKYDGCAATASKIIQVNPLPATFTLNKEGSENLCPGQTLYISYSSVSGPTYAFLKDDITFYTSMATSTTQAITQAGTYKIRATNSYSCSRTTDPLIVTVNSAPTASISPSASYSKCPSENLPLATPFVPGYSYVWTDELNHVMWSGANESAASFNPTGSGTYKVTVTNTPGCASTSAGINVAVYPTPPNPSISPSTAQKICPPANSSVVFTAAPNVGVSFIWMKDGSPISGVSTSTYQASSAGNYSVKLKNSYNCISPPTDNVPVTAGTDFSLSINGRSSFCEGRGVQLRASTNGIPGYSYQWSGGNTNLNYPYVNITQAGTYTVTVTDLAGCSRTASKSVTEAEGNTNGGSIEGSLFCLEQPGDVMTLTAYPNENATYQWSNGSSAPSITVGDGTYTVTINSAIGISHACFDVADCGELLRTRNEPSQPEKGDSGRITTVGFYPNPADKLLRITIAETSHKKVVFRLFNLSGATTLSKELENDNRTMEIDVTELAPGMYYGVVYGANMVLQRGIIVIVHQH
jgi:hypothetical protein